jgi:hypothetical protein
MFSKIKQLLSKKADGLVMKRELNSYFISELDSESNIPKSKYEAVLAHLNHELKLNVEEIEDLFSVESSQATYIFNSLKKIYYKASCEKSWDDQFIKALESNVVDSFVLKNAGSNEHCKFCLSKFDQEMRLTTQVLKSFHDNCKCNPYKKSYINPVIKF